MDYEFLYCPFMIVLRMRCAPPFRCGNLDSDGAKNLRRCSFDTAAAVMVKTKTMKRFTYMSIAPCRAPRQSRFVTHIDWWLETNLIEKTLNEHILASHELVMLAAGCYDSTGQFLRARICA